MKINFSRFNWVLASTIGAVGLLLSMDRLSATITPRGLLIYSDLANYTEACEYSSMVTGPVYATIIRANGQSFQLMTNAKMIPVEYPSFDPRFNTQEAADWNLEMIQLLSQCYPQFETRLKTVRSKWQNAMAFARQIAIKEDWANPLVTGQNSTETQSRRLPAGAFASFFAEAEEHAAIVTKVDPFAGFGGTKLDSRKGFIGTQSSLAQKTPESAATSVADESLSDDAQPAVQPFSSNASLSDAEANLRELINKEE